MFDSLSCAELPFCRTLVLQIFISLLSWKPESFGPHGGAGLAGGVFPSDSDVQLGCFVWGVGFCIWLPQKWLGSGSPPSGEAQKAFVSQCQYSQSFSGEVFGYSANMEINSYKSVFSLPENCPCKH